MCRTGWSSISPRPPGASSRNTPTKLTVDGRYLYGAPASGLGSRRRVVIQAAKERPVSLPAISSGVTDEDVPTVRQPLGGHARRRQEAKASFDVASREDAGKPPGRSKRK